MPQSESFATLPLCHFATLRAFALELAPVRQSSSMTLLSLNRNLKDKQIGELSTDVCYVLDEAHFRSALPLSPRLIASLTCAMLLRETGSDSWQCLMSNWVEPECETICST